MNANFKVQTEVFQGPLELLLQLVEKRKLFVNDVSLARVADDYVRHIESHQNLPLGQTAQFLVVASTLLLIKSRSLLPNVKLTDEEEQDIKELEERLRLYSKIREASTLLGGVAGKRQMLTPNKSQPMPKMFIKPIDLSLASLLGAVKSLINEFPTFIKKPEIAVESTISLPEMIDTLAERVKRAMQTRFSAVAEKGEKVELIVSFLALLELVRNGVVSVQQKVRFDDIDISTEQMSVPSY